MCCLENEFVDAQNIKERFPGIQGLGLIKHLENEEEIDELVQFMNSYGIMDFHVTPEGKRDKYYVVTYLEPHDFRNLRAIGYDIYSEPTRRQAAEIAEVTGKTTITGKIILIQETDKDIQSGFLMLQPVYDNKTSNHTMTESKENIAGFVYASFRIKDLMNATLEPLLLQNINLKIYDGSEA